MFLRFLKQLGLEAFAIEEFDKLQELVLHMLLLAPEVFIDCILENLAKQVDLCIILRIHLHSLDERRGPHHDQLLQTIPLIQVCVHELLHSLPWLPIGHA